MLLEAVAHHDDDFLDIPLFNVPSDRLNVASVEFRRRRGLVDWRGRFVAHVETPASSTWMGMTVSSSATYDCE